MMKEQTIRQIETAVTGIALGAVPIIACIVAGWWSSIPFVAESHIMYWALAGLAVGILLDVIFLKGWLRSAYSMRTWVWIAIYLFYSIGMFGFFMGVPVLNVLLAAPAGAFVGRRLIYDGADLTRMKKTSRQTAGFTTGIFGLACIASASIALLSPSTASELQHMLGLPFRVTPVMVLGLILVGGALILALNWWLTVESVERAYKYSTLVRSRTPTQPPGTDI